MIFCKHCGEPLDDPKNFCPHCGSKIEINMVSRADHVRRTSRINSLETSGSESRLDSKEAFGTESDTSTKEISRTVSRKKETKSESGIHSLNTKFKFKRLNGRVYVLIGLFILLAATYFIFDPFTNDIRFAQWGDLSDKEKVVLVTEFKNDQYPDIKSPTVDEIVKYCNLLYKDSWSKDDTVHSVVSEFIEWDTEERIRALAELSGDIID